MAADWDYIGYSDGNFASVRATESDSGDTSPDAEEPDAAAAAKPAQHLLDKAADDPETVTIWEVPEAPTPVEEAPDLPHFLLLDAPAPVRIADPEPRIDLRAGLTVFATALAVLALGWFVGIDGAEPEATIAEAEQETEPAFRFELPRANLDPETAAQLGDVEYRLENRRHARYIRVENGDTLLGVLTRAGASVDEARGAVASLAGIFDPRRLRPGRRIAVMFGMRDDRHNAFLGMQFDSAFDRVVSVERQQDDRYIATELRKQLTTEMVRGDGVVRSSLFQAGLSGSVPAATMIRLIHLFSFDVDFQRDIQPGDSFQVMYMRHSAQDGAVVRTGEVAYAALTLRGVTQRLYRYTTPSGRTDYFDEQGRGLRKALMRTPIDGARLSSSYGRRRHPILGYTRMHRGVDFAAPRGTPIYAAGDGTITYVGRRGGYGNYIRIRHTRNYETAYAHMRRFASNMSRGARVRQGQVIGYVGTTGRSTGPHLHYEVIRDGNHINPMQLRLPSNQSLEGAELERFQAYREEMDARFAELEQSGGTQVIVARSEADLSICVNGRRLDPTDGRPCEDEANARTTTADTQTVVTTRGD